MVGGCFLGSFLAVDLTWHPTMSTADNRIGSVWCPPLTTWSSEVVLIHVHLYLEVTSIQRLHTVEAGFIIMECLYENTTSFITDPFWQHNAARTAVVNVPRTFLS